MEKIIRSKPTKFILPLLLVWLLFIRLPWSKSPLSQRENVEVTATVVDPRIEVVAQNLSIPWEIAFLPDGDLLVTERSGRLLKIGKETRIVSQIAQVKHLGEGGLLGLALHPNFSQNNYLYIYYTTDQKGVLTNQIERYVFKNDTLSDPKIILAGIKGSKNHDGGRIAFGPDGYLYVTTGDAENSKLAQDPSSLNGKILRIINDNKIEIYSLGHRNPQGLAWDDKNQLWSTEHGPSGLQTGYDELNKITQNSNYGWPKYKGDQTAKGFVPPILQSGSKETWAPASLAYYRGSLYFAGLKGETLYQYVIKTNTLTKHFTKHFGRLRAVSISRDGYLYLSTSNTDGRGTPKPNDDQIFKILLPLN